MGNIRRVSGVLVCALACGLAVSALAQSRGVRVITAEDMKPYLRFLGSVEFRGRSAPSLELDIASKYLAVEAARIGLQPLLPNGSYLQPVPVEVTTLSTTRSSMRVTAPGIELRFAFPQSFSPGGRETTDWTSAGELVFAGSMLAGADPTWDDGQKLPIKGRFVVVLESPPPAGAAGAAASPRPSTARLRTLREHGAIGLITIIARERESVLAQRSITFDVPERLRFLDVDTVNPAPPAAGATPAPSPAPVAPMTTIEMRHEAGAALLGLSREELDGLFEAIARGQSVSPRALGRSVEIAARYDRRTVTTPNVVAYLPGSDPKLRDEYVVVGSHHDHMAPREGRVYPGADDNASGSVAMLAIAKAMMVERPRRSVIFVWHTAEERGLIGAYYFVQHCPVPVERISANLNLDMITRNDPNGIYLIGTTKLSSELDRSFQDINRAHTRLTFDYRYDDPAEPNNFFFRSDQYPYIRYGIPGVWIFCGTTSDYHQPGDVEEKADYAKMEKVTRLTYLVAMDIGNKPALLALDVHPEVKTRGAHNMKVVWRRPAARR